MLKAQLQVVINSLVGDLAEQCQVGNTDLLLLRTLEHSLLDLRFAGLATIADICNSF